MYTYFVSKSHQQCRFWEGSSRLDSQHTACHSYSLEVHYYAHSAVGIATCYGLDRPRIESQVAKYSVPATPVARPTRPPVRGLPCLCGCMQVPTWSESGVIRMCKFLHRMCEFLQQAFLTSYTRQVLQCVCTSLRIMFSILFLLFLDTTSTNWNLGMRPSQNSWTLAIYT
jgi:hypothetical protein